MNSDLRELKKVLFALLKLKLCLVLFRVSLSLKVKKKLNFFN